MWYFLLFTRITLSDFEIVSMQESHFDKNKLQNKEK